MCDADRRRRQIPELLELMDALAQIVGDERSGQASVGAADEDIYPVAIAAHCARDIAIVERVDISG